MRTALLWIEGEWNSSGPVPLNIALYWAEYNGETSMVCRKEASQLHHLWKTEHGLLQYQGDSRGRVSQTSSEFCVLLLQTVRLDWTKRLTIGQAKYFLFYKILQAGYCLFSFHKHVWSWRLMIYICMRRKLGHGNNNDVFISDREVLPWG